VSGFFDSHVRIMLGYAENPGIASNFCWLPAWPQNSRLLVDNTNPWPSDRARYIGVAREAGFRVIAYFFDTTLRDAISGTISAPVSKRFQFRPSQARFGTASSEAAGRL